MKIPTDCAENLAVTMCGGRLKPHVVDGGCDTIRFEGIEDATVNQGAGIDLRDGITAYDGDGNEIEYEVEPSELAPCEVGEFDIEYRASGKGLTMKPTVCGRNKVHAVDCGLDTVVEHRLITVTQADPPTISGVGETVIGENTDFDPLDGVSAVDDNGNVLEVEYSGKYLQEATGGIASFESEYEDPLHSLKVSLEPIQDLNGYDKPWAGGAGRNLLNVGGRVNQTTAEVRYTSDDNYIILNGTKNGGGYATMGNLTLTLPAGTYYAKAFVISGTTTGTIDVYVNNGTADITGSLIGSSERTIALESETTLRFRFAVWNDGTVLTNYTVGIVISKTSGIDKFYPYSNICPISGHTECVTEVCGRNLFDEANATIYKRYFQRQDGGVYKWSAAGDSTSFALKCLPNTTYTIKSNNPNAKIFRVATINVDISESELAILNQVSTASNPRTITTDADATYIVFQINNSIGVVREGLVQIEYGSTATAYEPYNGTTYTTDLGRTVYGGTLDVVSGELVVDRAMVDLGTLNWAYQSSTQRFIADITDAKRPPNNYTEANIVCSIFATVTTEASERPANDQCVALSRYGTLGVRDSSHTDVASFTSAVSGVQLCYELATPQTIQLTPQEVRTLLGTNNVWADGVYHPLVKRYLKDNSWVGKYVNGVMYYVNNGYGYLHTDTFKDASVSCSHFAVKKFVPKPTDTSTPLADNGLYLTDDGSLYARYDAVEDADPTVSLRNWINFVTDNNVYLTVPSYGDTASDSLDLTLQYNAPIPQGEAYKYIAQGTYTVTYRAVDQCGNETEVVRNITVGENIPVRRTVLRQDGTLVINELASEYYANNEIYGAIVKEFEPYDENNRYIFTLNNLPLWYADKNSITNVVVGEHIYPTQLDLWFYGLSNAETWELARLHTENATSMHRAFASAKVENLNFAELDTSKVEDFSNMFTQALVGGGNDHYLDLSTWDTSSAINMSQMFVAASIGILNIANFTTPNVTNINLMFANSSSQMLQTIYCNSDFDLTNAGNNVQMFGNNPNLVGGNGTTYDASHTTSEYARLDNPPSAPGYFTVAPDSDITNEEDIEITNEDDEPITT